MRQVVLRVPAHATEDALDALLPRIFDGVHVLPRGADEVELVAFERTHPLPSQAELRALAIPALLDIRESEAPEAWSERRRLLGDRGTRVAGRVWLRAPDDKAAPPGDVDVIVDRRSAFGSGAHPTTRMCIETLLVYEPVGSFADLGCGAGALAIVAAKLGFAPVVAVDYSDEAVATAAANAGLNDVAVEVHALDLMAEAPPSARLVAANVPPPVHLALAARLPAAVQSVVVSGITPPDRAVVTAAYTGAGFTNAGELAEGGWLAVRMERP